MRRALISLLMLLVPIFVEIAMAQQPAAQPGALRRHGADLSSSARRM